MKEMATVKKRRMEITEYSQTTRRASEVISKANGQQGQVYG